MTSTTTTSSRSATTRRSSPRVVTTTPTATVLLDEDNDLDPDPGKAWIAFFDDGSVPDGGDFEVAIFGNGRDNYGDCDTTRPLASSAPRTGAIVDEGGAPLPGISGVRRR